MRFIRQGIDIVSVRRIGRSIETQGQPFLDRVFTSREQSYCNSKRRKFEHYAARFAAKEAVVKVLKLPKSTAILFREIDIRRKATGKPYVVLSKKLMQKAKLASRKFQLEISMSHERDHAIAIAVLVISK